MSEDVHKLPGMIKKEATQVWSNKQQLLGATIITLCMLYAYKYKYMDLIFVVDV